MNLMTFQPVRKVRHPSAMMSIEKALNELFNDAPRKYKRRPASKSQPAVNILEGKDAFNIELFAPGLTRADFQVELEQDTLSIAVEGASAENNNFLRKEFDFSGFTKRFEIPETIDRAGISASYEQGVLSIVLPKVAEAKEAPARKIEIA